MSDLRYWIHTEEEIKLRAFGYHLIYWGRERVKKFGDHLRQKSANFFS